MKRSFYASVAALALLLAVGANAQAVVPANMIQWTYNFSPGAPAVFADGNESAGVTFTNEPTKAATGNSDIVASNLRVFSTATATAPDMITNGEYSLTMTLSTTDSTGVHTGTVTFAGTLSGTFSAENAGIANVFGPNSSQVLDLGSVRFTVDLLAYTPPGPPDQANAGSIAARVTVGDTTTEPPGVPEPSTILLGGLGLTFLGGVAWRKRRQARAADRS
jgi:hypothetical protein